jgi:pyridoxine 5-phosphate synthase
MRPMTGAKQITSPQKIFTGRPISLRLTSPYKLVASNTSQNRPPMTMIHNAVLVKSISSFISDLISLMPCKLSVNINKFATLRNSRGGNNPDLVKAAIDAQRFGADGITVHPRPDERHIRYADVHALREVITTEFNIEGNPREPRFVELVLQAKPHQVTLVPDAEGQLTSDHGWDTLRHKDYLTDTIGVFREAGIRVSIFVDADERMVEGAATTGTDRIELYTEGYARQFAAGEKEDAVRPYVLAAERAAALGLQLNAGHDLDLANLRYFYQHIPSLLEVSIGHALICDALYLGLENVIQLYKRELVIS